MNLSSAVKGFLAIVLSFSVIQGQTDWAVKYGSTKICAFKGSTVDMRSTFTYPLRMNGRNTAVEQMFWYTKLENGHPVDLRTDSQYAGRMRYGCREKTCTLSITDLRESDSALYKFRFITNQINGTPGTPGVDLSVTGLQVQKRELSPCKIYSCKQFEMTCSSSCTPQDSSYIWYQNEKKTTRKRIYSDHFYPTDSISCALKGFEDFSSPTICVPSGSCTAVSYKNRSICAFTGSSVTISCTYNSKRRGTEFWFRHRESEDLLRNPRYTGRAQSIVTRDGISTLTISDLTSSDSGEYRFKFGGESEQWTKRLPGTSLKVTDPDIEVQVIFFSTLPKLICHSSCLRPGHSSFEWYNNGERILNEESYVYGGIVGGGENLLCAYNGYRSRPVYAPKVPKVSKSNSGDVMKDSSMSLTCSGDANPPAKYFWYKNGEELLNQEELVFRSIQPSDSGEYRCGAVSDLGSRMSDSVVVNVKYGPGNSSVSISPSGEIVEGNAVTLTCRSDANPAATYTWYKGNESLSKEQKGLLQFTAISDKDRGNYFCKSENQHGWTRSTLQFLDVQYGPKLPSVSVNSSGGIPEGSSVTLTCSSDANPAANLTWYKEGESTPQASGHTFTIDVFKPEHGGSYFCEAANVRGRQRSTLRLTVAAGQLGSWKSAAIGASAVFALTLALLGVYLYMRRSEELKQHKAGETSSNQVKMGPVHSSPSGAAERQPAGPAEDCEYSVISSPQGQTEALYSNIGRFTPQTERVEEENDLQYSVITFDHIARRRYEENGNDFLTVYSTVNKISTS